MDNKLSIDDLLNNNTTPQNAPAPVTPPPPQSVQDTQTHQAPRGSTQSHISNTANEQHDNTNNSQAVQNNTPSNLAQPVSTSQNTSNDDISQTSDSIQNAPIDAVNSASQPKEKVTITKNTPVNLQENVDPSQINQNNVAQENKQPKEELLQQQSSISDANSITSPNIQEPNENSLLRQTVNNKTSITGKNTLQDTTTVQHQDNTNKSSTTNNNAQAQDTTSIKADTQNNVNNQQDELIKAQNDLPQSNLGDQNASKDKTDQPVQESNTQSITNNMETQKQKETVTPSTSETNTVDTPPQNTTSKTTEQTEINVPTTTTNQLDIFHLLEMVVQKNASDLHIVVGYPPMLRIDGDLIPAVNTIVTTEDTQKMIYNVLSEQNKELLEVNKEVDFAYAYKNHARFRVNAFHAKGKLSAAFRLIPNKIRTIEELQLPKIYHEFVNLRQGLVLVTGPTGHGKSTTLAAILNEINMKRPVHIVTIEDPIEYVYPRGKAIVNQREMHQDTHSWEIALRSVLREDTDIVLVGEMRDFETISAAITVAETGHLIFATLHTNSAAQTMDRIIDVFPEHQQAQIRIQLSNVIEGVVAQRLIKLIGGGRRAVAEVMLATPAIRNVIREGKTHQLDNIIRTSGDVGMISLEKSLVNLVREGVISVDDAQVVATNPEEVTRLLK